MKSTLTARYGIKQNSVLSGMATTVSGAPLFASGKHGLRVKNREFISDVIAPNGGAFSVNTYAINPAVSATFPFLSQVACNYEQYRIHGCVFYFRSTSSNALSATNAALGTVILACKYDADASAFGSKFEMENYEYASSGRPSVDLLYPVECANSLTPQTVLYTRQNALNPSTLDKKNYDFGLFQIATAGGQQGADSTIGELWVTYDVELLKPKLFENFGFSNPKFESWNSTGIAGATPLGTATAWSHLATPVVGVNSLGVTMTATTIGLPAGLIPGSCYDAFVYWTGGAATVSPVTPTLSSSLEFTSNLTGSNFTGGFVQMSQGGLAGQTGFGFYFSFRVKKAGGQTTTAQTITFPAFGTVLTTSVTVIVNQVGQPYGW